MRRSQSATVAARHRESSTQETELPVRAVAPGMRLSIKTKCCCLLAKAKSRSQSDQATQYLRLSAGGIHVCRTLTTRLHLTLSKP